MSYTIITTADGGPVATVVPSVIEALRLVRDIEPMSDHVTIASDTGWILSIEELEELAKP